MGCVAVKTVISIIPFKVAMLINNIISFNDIIFYMSYIDTSYLKPYLPPFATKDIYM